MFSEPMSLNHTEIKTELVKALALCLNQGSRGRGCGLLTGCTHARGECKGSHREYWDF